jgi:hypothetical protein
MREFPERFIELEEATASNIYRSNGDINQGRQTRRSVIRTRYPAVRSVVSLTAVTVRLQGAVAQEQA